MMLKPFHYISLLFTLVIIIVGAFCINSSIAWWWLILVIFIYFAILFYGVVNIRLNFFFKSYNTIPNTQYIALTFDDGPNTQTEAILDILKEQDVKATFFCIGKHIDGRGNVFKRISDEGHIIGNHSHEHTTSFDWKSSSEMYGELMKANETIKAIIGKTPKLFRPPYGITNPNLAKAVKESGMYSIGWSVRSFDTMIKDREKLLLRVLGSLKGGDIILLHDSMVITSEILTDLIVKAREKGFIFTPLDEALGLDAYEKDI